ncbi:MAG: hypothetical protein KA191_08735 [Verrucomicrobia bacterium]|nr:hypothetical protein [Verrucomicrobiota bacterium]OQC65773.1 MAG: hypothetical protein BWX48_02209 [Verrucomicrobia bacterium ADurb.Bin006]NMD19060.1 hypothetical protein [Verrucomicrobiota bacterium]HOA60330.1 hypothetical protein [Verrucomicrobiota bacterium]HOF48135.1 hypothetical protein [Verrucomicrobiota bacterium]
MKSRFLLLVLIFSLGSATGLAQFSLTASLNLVDNSYVLSLTASGPRDVSRVESAHFVIEIRRNIDWSRPLTEPLETVPSFYESYFDGTPSPGIAETPFVDSQSYSFLHKVYSGSIGIWPEIGSGVDCNWNSTTGNEVSVPFKTSGPQLMLNAGISIPSDLEPGKWRLVLMDGSFNELKYINGENNGENNRIWFSNLQADYTLTYDGENLTLEVPEPSQFAVVGGLALLGFAGWRRSRN